MKIMLVSFDLRFQFLLVLIFYSRLLVDNRAVASAIGSSYSSAYIANSSTDLLLSGYARNVSSSSVRQLHDASNLQATFILSSTFSPGGNSTVFAYVESTDNYQSGTPGSISKTSSVRNAERSISMNGTISTRHSRTFQNVSTTRVAELRSSGIVTAPISSAVNANYSSVKSSQTAVPELLSSKHEHKSNETSTKTLSSNSTAIFSLFNGTSIVKDASSNFSISKTSEYVRRTTEVSSSVLSVVSPQANKTNIHHTTVSSRGNIQWTNTSANLSVYEGSTGLNRSNRTAVMSYFTASPHPSASKSLSSSGIDMVNKSKNSPARSSVLFLLNTTRGVRSVNVTVVSLSKNLNSSSGTIPNSSSIQWKAEETINSTSTSTRLSSTLLPAQLNNNNTSRVRSGASKFGNISATVSVIPASSTWELNSSHDEHYGINTSHTSYIIPVPSGILLNISSRTRQEFETKVHLSSPSMPVPSLNTDVWNANSVKEQQFSTVHLAASSRNDMFGNSTIAIGSSATSVLRYSNKTSAIGHTADVYSTSLLPTLTLFTEQIIKNTTSTSLPKGNHTATLIFSKSVRSMAENMSSVDSIEKTTYNATINMKPFTSHSSERQKTETKSKELVTESWAQNISSSILVSNLPTSVVRTTVLPLKYSTTHVYNTSFFPFLSKVLSTSISSSIATSKSDIPFGSKSSVLINSSQSAASSHFELSTESLSNIKAVINSTNQVYHGSSTIQSSSDLLVHSTAEVTKRSSPIMQPSSSLPVLTNSSNMNRVSLIPIYTPCYISYMVTVSRIVTHSFVASTVDIETGAISSIQQPLVSSHSNDQSHAGSTPLQPTPSTRFLVQHSSTEMFSKSLTQSLSRLPESSMQSKHDATVTKSNTRSATINKPNYTQAHNFTKSDISISNVAVSSSVLHELTVNRNLTADIRNHTTLLIDHSRSISVQNFSVKISKSLNTFPLPNKSTSIVAKYVNFNVSITTTTTSTSTTIVMNSTSPMLNVRMSSNSISGSPFLSYSAPTKSELAYTSMIENATTLAGHSVRFGSNSVNKSSHQSSNIIPGSVLRQETSISATATSPLFTKHITLHPTQSSSVQLGIALSTVSAKQVHQTVSPIVNISNVQSSTTFYKSSFSNLSRNVKTSQDAHATLSLNHMFSNRSNTTTTAYSDRHDTSVALSPSSFSFNLTNVRIYETTMSTLATVSNLSTIVQSNKTENRNLPQPTPVLSRTPSLNSLSLVLGSSIPILTSKESLSNQNTSAKSTLLDVSGFVNSTLIPLSSSTESNISIFSYKPTVESTSSLDVPNLSNRTTVALNSSSDGNKTMLITSSIPVVSRYTRNTSAIHGQNVSPIVSATISMESIQFTSTDIIHAASIRPTVVLATESNLNSQWMSHKNDHTSNSLPADKTISYSSFHATPSISESGEPGTNPLRRKRREVSNLTVTQDHIGANSTKNVVKHVTTTLTVNISSVLVSTSSWKTKESVGLRNTERFLPTQTGSLHRTVKTRLTPTPVINVSKATPSPLLVTTSSLEKWSMISSWILSSSRLANESRSLTNGYNSLSVPILSPSVEIDHSAASMVSPKRTSSAITSTVRNSSLVETFLSPNNSSIVSSTTNSVNEDLPLMTASASQLGSSQGMNTEQYNTSITNGTNSDKNSRLSNRSSLTPTITQKQRIMITQSTSIHHSVALTPSITIYKKSVSSNLKMSAKQAVMSTSLNVGMISNSSIINYSSLITTAKSISSPNITLSMTQGKYEKKVNASESTLNTSMTASLNISIGTYPPTIQDSSYISTTQYTSSSNLTSFSSQLRHETKIHVSKSLVNTGILESTVMSRTQLLVKSSLYSMTYARMNATTTNNTVRTESNVTAVKSTNSVFPPTSIDDENSRNTSQMRVSHSSTSLRLVLETTVGNESLALMPSPVTTLRTSVTADKLSLYQSENMYSVVNSSHRMMSSSAGTFKFSHHSFISVSSSPTSSFHNPSLDNIRTTSLVKSTLSRAITNGLIPQSSENVTSSISPASVSAHSHNVTSLIHGNISDASSTVSTSYIPMAQSPSPSFSIIGSKVITATPTLPKDSYISSAAILSQSSSFTTTDGKAHFMSNSSVTLAGESSSILSRILRTESRSKAIVITSEKQSGGYYLIPTSSLGLCLVSYSTIFVNISVQTPVTLNTTPVNTTSSLQTPLSMPSSGEINSTRIFTSSVVIRSNVRTSGFVKPSLVSSSVVNKSSISFNSSGVILSTSPFKTSYSGMNTSSLGQSLSKSAENATIFQSSTMAYSKSPLPITSQTDIPELPSPTLSKTTATYTFKTYTVINISPNMSLTSSLYQISPTVSYIVQSSSVATTHAPTSTVDKNSILVIALKVPESTNIRNITFQAILEGKLYEIYQKGLLVQRRRRKRSTLSDSRVEVQNIQRNGQEVDVRYIVIANNRTLLAEDAAKIMDVFTVQKMSSIIGYEVLSRPRPVKTIVPGSPVLAMLVNTTSQNNLSNAAIKNEFEVELARFYRNSESLPVTKTVNATITQIFHDPLGRTYIEFIITVDNVAVDRTIVMKSFASGAILSSTGLNQMVLVAPYIPGMLQPREMDYIIQNMQFNNVRNLEAIKNEISNKLTRVYVNAQLNGVQKRRKRALGSIDAVVTGTSWTQGFSADVTYYITDAGSILNATYACSILKRLTLDEMSSSTAPYTVNSTPRPRTPTTSGTSTNDDDYPSWFIPVVVAGSVGFLLLVLIIILYCRWKKGAPPKKIQPQAGSPIEEEVHKPRMTHAAEPEARPTLRRPPPTPTRPTVSVEENGRSEPRPKAAPRAPVRKLPVREGSVRKKVTSRESIITRTNPAYDPEEDSVDESVTDVRVPRSRRPETKVVVKGRTELEIPARAIPPQSVKKSLLSDAQDESDESEGESVITAKDSVFTENSNEYSAGTLPPIAVMSDPRPPEIQPPPIFRNTVHPVPSLPLLDPKQTSLIGRVVEEEGSVQKEMRTKADIERWRNKQRQREKRLGDSPSKSGNKRPSFTEKKAWGRAQQEIGAVLDPEAMQPVVRQPRRKRRKYKIRTETSDDEGNVELRGFRKITSPREEKVPKVEQESDSDVSMGEARRRLIGLIDDAFTSIKSASKKHHPETTDHVDAGEKPQRYPQSKHPPPLYPRPATLTPALPEPPPSHGRASVPSARHRRRFMNSQNSFPYPSQYYPGMSGGFSPRYPPPPPPPVVTRNPLIVWDPVDKQRTLTQTAYRSYGGHPYSYSDPSGKLHFTPVQQTPDGMGGLVWSPYATEYAMEDFYRNLEMPGTLDSKNSSFLSKMPETPLGTMPESTGVPRDAVIDMPDAGERGTTTGESAEPLVRAIKDELFRLASGRTPVKHM